jgi:hypothetical protein
MAKQVPLPSPIVSLQPNTPKINVQKDGFIDPNDAPARFLISQQFQEIVVWIVTNNSGQPITVTLTDFKLKNSMGAPKGTKLVKCMSWLAGNTAQVNAGQVGLLGAIIDPGYKMNGALDSLSYTIQVRSQVPQPPAGNGFPDVDYDPDGDIKP